MLELGRKLERFANALAIIVSGAAFSGMVLLISLNVISRYLFMVSFNWAEEITYLLFNWAVFFGAAALYGRQGLTAIDVLVNRMPSGIRRAAMILNFGLILAISSSLVVWGFSFAMRAWIRKSPALQISYFYYDLSIPLASVIMAGYALKFLILAVKGQEPAAAALEERS